MSKHSCPMCGCTLFQEYGPCAGADLLEKSRQVLSDHNERVGVYGELENQPNREHVMGLLSAAIAKAEGKP